MIYPVSRTSAGYDFSETPPVPGAIERRYFRVVSVPPDCPAASNWRRAGTVFTTDEKGWLSRLEETREWAVETPDLAAFVREHGQCVVKWDAERADPCLCIEIYDDYRE
jgi:hypothetical protein